MKLNHINIERRFSIRVLSDFTQGLFTLLQEKRLEDITVGELCEYCHYPRSTFYNYFEDIYALMDCCWEKVAKEIELDDYFSIDHSKRTMILFGKLHSYMTVKQAVINKLLVHNDLEGKMIQSLNNYIRKTIFQMIIDCPTSDKYPVPFELLAEHYGNTIQLLLNWCFLKKEKISKDQAIIYLKFLLGTLEKEVTRV